MSSQYPPPLAVQLTRGNTIESEHLVDVIVADRNGVRQQWGDPDRLTFPRSAIKAIQALPLIMTGAAERYDLSGENLALACSSHSAEEQHLTKVAEWLAKIGGSDAWLECGPARPLSDDVWLAVGPETTPLHNCCSGKHAGFLSVARHLDVATKNYLDYNHPVQKLVTEATEIFAGVTLDQTSAGIDGCGIPTFPLPIARLAQAMARLVDPVDVGQEWADACDQIVVAIKDRPWWVSGTGRHEVTITELASEPIVLKTGADGVFVAALPERRLGIACKARDGGRRASDATITAVLAHLGVVPVDAVPQPILNTLTNTVGELTVAGLG